MLFSEIKLKSCPPPPLFPATKNRHAGMVQLLLEAEADVEAADYGRTPLTYAAENRHEDMVKLLLLEKGADGHADIVELLEDWKVVREANDILRHEGGSYRV
jgi:ankyrin repeat protein